MSRDMFKYWIIQPFDVLAWSNREVSPVEKRDYLHRQEMAIEKMCRNWESNGELLEELVRIRKAEVRNIVQNNSYWDELSSSIWSLDDWISEMWNQLKYIWDRMWMSYRMNYDWFNNVIKWLWIANKGILKVESTIRDCTSSLISSISSIARINAGVLESLLSIDNKIWNPKKTAWLELKRDWFKFYKNWWYDEALRALNDAIEFIYTDYDAFYLIWIILLEEKKDYCGAKAVFEKAAMFSAPENKNIYASSLQKLAMASHIIWDFWIAFSSQLEASKIDDSAICWLNLARYSTFVGRKDVFEDSIYRTLKKDNLLILRLSTEEDFNNDPWKTDIITKVINTIASEDKQARDNRVTEIIDWWFFWAIDKWDFSAIEFLVKNNYPINCQDWKLNTPLNYLIKNRSISEDLKIKIAELLFLNNASMSIVDNEWNTPLHSYAINRTHGKLFNLIIKYSGWWIINSKNKNWDTPIVLLFNAFRSGDMDNYSGNIGLFIKSWAIIPKWAGWEVLIWAVTNKEEYAVEQLIKWKIDLDIKDQQGICILAKALQMEHFFLFTMMVDGWANVDIISKEICRWGIVDESPLSSTAYFKFRNTSKNVVHKKFTAFQFANLLQKLWNRSKYVFASKLWSETVSWKSAAEIKEIYRIDDQWLNLLNNLLG
ncbi:MAG: ankyrin 2,3/unc44 [uncultured bacterium (gcode 4)]|uniref:Ankyrin 2,3/unc44 n=1 Tax=uncultured bacterium (gcode 4) TaxID=1234023 RepID=K2GC61_9BACT|nr:MAG: ankyrin 2,3/unc44 [uncultured bacterium (gcode 4)]